MYKKYFLSVSFLFLISGAIFGMGDEFFFELPNLGDDILLVDGGYGEVPGGFSLKREASQLDSVDNQLAKRRRESRGEKDKTLKPELFFEYSIPCFNCEKAISGQSKERLLYSLRSHFYNGPHNVVEYQNCKDYVEKKATWNALEKVWIVDCSMKECFKKSLKSAKKKILTNSLVLHLHTKNHDPHGYNRIKEWFDNKFNELYPSNVDVAEFKHNLGYVDTEIQKELIPLYFLPEVELDAMSDSHANSMLVEIPNKALAKDSDSKNSDSKDSDFEESEHVDCFQYSIPCIYPDCRFRISLKKRSKTLELRLFNNFMAHVYGKKHNKKEYYDCNEYVNQKAKLNEENRWAVVCPKELCGTIFVRKKDSKYHLASALIRHFHGLSHDNMRYKQHKDYVHNKLTEQILRLEQMD